MESENRGWTRRERMLLAVAGAALALSIVALLSTGEPSVAGKSDEITSSDIRNGSVKGRDIAKRSLKGKHIADGSLTAGDAGVYVTEEYSPNIPPGQNGQAEATCKNGDVAVGGGWEWRPDGTVPDSASNVPVVWVDAAGQSNPPVGPFDEWVAVVYNNSPEQAKIQVSAICMNG